MTINGINEITDNANLGPFILNLGKTNIGKKIFAGHWAVGRLWMYSEFSRYRQTSYPAFPNDYKFNLKKLFHLKINFLFIDTP